MNQMYTPETSQEESVVVKGYVAQLAADTLRKEYYYRDEVAPEIDDIAYADGPVENLKNAVAAMTKKVDDRYTEVQLKDEIDRHAMRSAGVENIKTGQRFKVWTQIMRANGHTVGYINLPSFFEHSAHELRKKLKKLPRKNGNRDPIDSLVLDLRGNRGGRLSEAHNVIATFADSAKYKLATNSRQGFRKMQVVNPSVIWPIEPSTHLTILIDQISASCSNIVAGTLQRNFRAMTVGEKSNRKCCQQSFRRLSHHPKIQLKYTSGQIFMPDGTDIQGDGGLVPDYLADSLVYDCHTSDAAFDQAMFEPPISVESMAKFDI